MHQVQQRQEDIQGELALLVMQVKGLRLNTTPEC